MHVVNIDGILVEVEHETTILDAARKAGIWLPALCYNPSVSALAACR